MFVFNHCSLSPFKFSNALLTSSLTSLLALATSSRCPRMSLFTTFSTASITSSFLMLSKICFLKYFSLFQLFPVNFCQTPVLGLGLGVDFTFAWDNHKNHKNHNDNTHLNFVK